MSLPQSTESGGRGRAWLELMRLSNLPTCLTNVLVGVALAAAPGAAFSWLTFAGVAAAVALLYVGGMALNDVIDAPIDAAQRSARPIPSGRIARRHALVFAVSALVLGGGGLAWGGATVMAWGLALVALIVVYDLIHKRFAASVILMGACRGLVYIVSATAVNPDAIGAPLLTVAALMTLYIAAVTAIARGEHRDARVRGTSSWLHSAIPVIPLLAVFVIQPTYPDRAIAMGLFVILWAGRSVLLLRSTPPRPKDAIMGWLAGICLVDAYTLTLLDQRGLAMIAIGLFVITWLGHRRILGT